MRRIIICFMEHKTATEQIHSRLERLRREKKMTAKTMSRLIGVPESTYREWEYGRGMSHRRFKRSARC